METEKMVESRGKTALLLLGSLAFVAAAFLLPSKPGEHGLDLLAGGFFGLCALAAIGRLIRPSILTLDQTGFTVTDFLGRKTGYAWGDIQPFFLAQIGRGGSMIAYNFIPGREPKTALLKISRTLGADAAIAGTWPKSKAQMVEYLNAYRTRALAQASGPTRPAT